MSDKEQDPTGRNQHEPGSKLDAGKPMASLLSHFGLALLEVAKVGTFGAKKYTFGGWQEVPEGVLRYSDAMWRHLCKEHTEAIDKDSGMLHQAQIAWNALARLELMLRASQKESTDDPQS